MTDSFFIEPWQVEETGHGLESRREYTALLVVDGRRLELGSFGAEAAANRLVETIFGFVGIRNSLLSVEN